MARLVGNVGKTLDTEVVGMRRSPGFGLDKPPADLMREALAGDSEARKKIGLYHPKEPGFKERAAKIGNNNSKEPPSWWLKQKNKSRRCPKVKQNSPDAARLKAPVDYERMVDVYRWLIVRRLEGICRSIQEIKKRLTEAGLEELTDDFLDRIVSDYHRAIDSERGT